VRAWHQRFAAGVAFSFVPFYSAIHARRQCSGMSPQCGNLAANAAARAFFPRMAARRRRPECDSSRREEAPSPAASQSLQPFHAPSPQKVACSV